MIGDMNWKSIQSQLNRNDGTSKQSSPATVKGGNRGQSFGLRDEILAASMLVIEGGGYHRQRAVAPEKVVVK